MTHYSFFKKFGLSLVVSCIAVLMQAQAVFAAPTMDVVPTQSGTKYIGHQFTVDVRVNTDSSPVDTISIRNLNFDPTKLQYVSTSVQTIFASQTTIANTGGSGFRQVDIGKLPLTANYSNTSPTTIVRFTFLPINTGGGATGTTTLTLDYDPTPSTTGTYLAGTKTLSAVTPVTIDLAEDNTPPIISNCTPSSGQSGIPVTTSVSCDVTDLQTGIHLGGTTLTVHGVTYAQSGPIQYVAVPISGGYRLTATPASQLPYATAITVSATTQDQAYDNGPVLARNSTTLPSYQFVTEVDDDPPQIYNRNPAAGAINIATTSNVQFRVRDIHVPGGYPGTGVNLSSLQVTLSAPGWGPVTYTQSGSDIFTVTALTAPWDYQITIDPATDFPQNTVVTAAIEADDLDPTAPGPNHLSTSYTFTTLDSTPPSCVAISPTPAAVTVANSTVVQLRCTDAGTGIDLTTAQIIVNGVIYTLSGPQQFSQTGTPQDYVFTVDPSTDFVTNTAFEVVVRLRDQSANEMPLFTYGLATAHSPLTCGAASPSPSATTSCPATSPCPVCQNIVTTVVQTSAAPSTQSSVRTQNSETDGAQTQVVQRVEQIPFRTTEAELENVQLLEFNGQSIGSELKEVIIREKTLVFRGTAQQYANVTLLVESSPLLLTTIADQEGKWQIEVENLLAVGKHTVYGVARNEKTGQITQKLQFATFVVERPVKRDWTWLIFVFFAFCLGFATQFFLAKLFAAKSHSKSQRLTHRLQ
jgi:hypothetical protein